MVVYNFKTIAVVPAAKDFIDIILSKTQRKTPTVVHNGYAISRIRRFYMRKIKYTQENYHDKLNLIITEFPRLDDIHPFYSDLINILYSRDHYKLALGQLNTCKSLIDNLGKEYLKLIKFSDTLYRCKELKRAALGRMCTIIKKCTASLAYLEQVRQHLSRLPSIDPHTRTVLVTGFPNTGKSSFLNKVSNANVEVQPYAFTTKSLFVGHTDYKYMRWQVIDTPGILDHPLEQRNTIEMQAITALAHLNATILYFIDPSEQCGYSLKQQCSLFSSIQPLFANKPLLIICNKADIKRLDQLDDNDRIMIEDLKKGHKDTQIMSMSNITSENITHVLHTACDILLQHRVEKKMSGNKINEVVNRIQVAMPVKRDEKERPSSIPPAVLEARERKRAKLQGATMEDDDTNTSSKAAADADEKPKRRTEREIELENGGPGIYNFDLRKQWVLSNLEWRHDAIPEIMDGKNIADFIDTDIERQLMELEKEEDELQRAAEAAGAMEPDDDELDEEELETVRQIRYNRGRIIADNRLRQTNNKPVLPRSARSRGISLAAVERTLRDSGKRSDKFVERSRSRSRTRVADVDAMTDEDDSGRGRKRTRSTDRDGDTDMSGADDDGSRSRSRSLSRSRSMSIARRDGSAQIRRGPSPFRSAQDEAKAVKLTHLGQRPKNREARKGEADRRVFDMKPKHMLTGKRTIGKTDRR